jgi:UDP-N-acetylmuramoylalanine--D-glutamate ligase
MIPVRGFEGKQVAVFGLARTGLAAARALAAGGARPVVWDEKPMAREAAKAEGLELCDLTTADWSQFAALMLSPGVPLTHPHPHWTVERAKAAGVEIVGDVELFARTVNLAPDHKRPKVVAITGTNGKSTTTALVGHICRVAGRDTRVGGNIGYGVLGLDDMHGGSVFVLELSSYQLDLTSSLRADASVILNISPDHLDRHGGMEGYVAAKRRILLNQGKGDTAVIGVDDPWGQRICTEITAANRRTIVPISASKAMGRGVYALQGLLYDATGERAVEIADLLRARSLPGRHNWQNAAAAYAAARQALSSYPKVYWIAGGQPKSGGIEPLADLFPRVEKAYLVGEAAPDFARTLRGKADFTDCGTIDAAVARAYADAAASGQDAIVLLSPACASFDQFTDFEARGDAFRAAVQGLALEEPKGARA